MPENRGEGFSLRRWLKDHLLSSRVKSVRGNISSGAEPVSIEGTNLSGIPGSSSAAPRETISGPVDNSAPSSFGPSTRPASNENFTSPTSAANPTPGGSSKPF